MGGANGLIVAFVVAVWAAYFVPLVLRRYDEASSSSSLESLSPLSRVISRRAPEAGDEPAEATPAPEPAAPPVRRATAVAARRRRRTLLTLLAVLAAVGGLAVGSVVSPVWVLVPVALVVAWLVACRVQVRSELGLSRRPSVTTTATADPADEDTVVVSGQVEDVDPGRRHVMQAEPLAVDALDEQVVIAVPSVSTAGEALWDPLPVTLPTYVTKPRVGRTVRTIDFDQPGAWTSGHVEGEDVELPGRPAQQEEAPRRASGA